MHKNTIWDRIPPTYTSIAVYMCVGGVQGSQIFKQNSIISICSKVLVISLSPWSPHCPCGPHIVPIIPTLSPSSSHCPRHPHIVPIAPRRSPCGLHGCGICGLHGLHPVLSPWSLRCPCHPHVIPVICTLSRRSPHHPQPPRYPLHPPPPPLQ